jgi:hypothetical protein
MLLLGERAYLQDQFREIAVHREEISHRRITNEL